MVRINNAMHLVSIASTKWISFEFNPQIKILQIAIARCKHLETLDLWELVGLRTGKVALYQTYSPLGVVK